MVWVDKIAATEGIYSDTSNENRNEAKKRFEELIHKYHKDISKEIKLEYKLRKGKIYHELDGLARITGALMIVTGAHGISGFEEYWIGSNAFKIVTYSNCPVITVRHDFPEGKGIDRILVRLTVPLKPCRNFHLSRNSLKCLAQKSISLPPITAS